MIEMRVREGDQGRPSAVVRKDLSREALASRAAAVHDHPSAWWCMHDNGLADAGAEHESCQGIRIELWKRHGYTGRAGIGARARGECWLEVATGAAGSSRRRARYARRTFRQRGQSRGVNGPSFDYVNFSRDELESLIADRKTGRRGSTSRSEVVRAACQESKAGQGVAEEGRQGTHQEGHPEATLGTKPRR